MDSRSIYKLVSGYLCRDMRENGKKISDFTIAAVESEAVVGYSKDSLKRCVNGLMRKISRICLRSPRINIYVWQHSFLHWSPLKMLMILLVLLNGLVYNIIDYGRKQ